MAAQKAKKVIAHFLDGSLLKGTSTNFSPTRARFEIKDLDGSEHSIHIKELKALFFVRTFEGRRDQHARKGFFAEDTKGDKVMIEFFDGEILFGYSAEYDPDGYGFYMTPGDPESNNEKVFVVHTSTKRSKVKTTAKKKRPSRAKTKRKKRRQTS